MSAENQTQGVNHNDASLCLVIAAQTTYSLSPSPKGEGYSCNVTSQKLSKNYFYFDLRLDQPQLEFKKGPE